MGQGRDAVKAILNDNPELLDEIETKIKNKVMGKEEEEPVAEVVEK